MRLSLDPGQRTLSIRTVIWTLAACCVALPGLSAFAQITPIHDVQYTLDPSGDSPLLGQTVTVEGVVTATQNGGFYITDAPGGWSSVFVYTRAAGCALEVGDQVTVTGNVAEYYGSTEITDPSSTVLTTCSVSATGNAVTPLPLATVDAGQEQYEGVLVQLSSVNVVSLLGYGEWEVDDGSGPMTINDEMDFRYAPAVADTLDSLTGVINYSFGAFKVNPRTSDDIVVDPQRLHFALHGDVVTMNDTMDVLTDHYVEVDGEHIVGITATPPAGVQVVDVGGLIYPGLIDAHNHPQYNVLGPIPFGQLFADRYEWQAEPLYTDFNTQRGSILDYPTADAQYNNVWKQAEVRALIAGTTMIQGSNPYSQSYDEFARLGIGIHNVGRHPSHSWSVTFPLTYAYWDDLQAEYWNSFAIHLSEGVNQAAFDEFTTAVADGIIDWRTAIIHGVPLGPTEWSYMAAAGAHLIWSPRSNWVLYGATAQVPDALAAGVNVALSTDWTESGSRDILDELRFAEQVNQSQWSGALSTEFLASSVTRNAALALGIDDRVGRIAPGYDADLAVFPGDPATPYDALLDTRPCEVKLVVVGGRPSYGDPTLMNQFPTLANVEDLVVCGHRKHLVLAVDNFAIPESELTFAEVSDQLWEAYQQSAPKVCEFMSVDPCRADTLFIDGFETGDPSAWSGSTP